MKKIGTQSFQPYHDFRIRVNSQLFGISDRLNPETINEWLDDIEVPETIEAFFLYIQTGVDKTPFVEKVKAKFPEVEIRIVPNVPADEMNKIIEFCENHPQTQKISK